MFRKNTIGTKACLDLSSSSPHILVVGGSQSGKSSAVKAILVRLMGFDPKQAASEKRLKMALVVLGILSAALIFIYPFTVIVLPIEALFYAAGQLNQFTAFASFLLYFTILASICTGIFSAYKFFNKLPAENRKTVILDFHGEYGFLANEPSFGFAKIDASEYDPLAFGYVSEPFADIATDFVEAFQVTFETIGDVQLAILKRKLEETRSVTGALSFIDAANKSARSYTEKDRLSGLSLRLEKISRYSLGRKNLSEMADWDRNIIFDFSSIKDKDAADFFAENMLRRVQGRLSSQDGGFNIILDEAHRLNTRFLSEKGVETSTVRIARESGKFGARLIISSQNLTDFPGGFSSNFGNIICFRTPSGSELQNLEKMTGISYGLLQSVMNGLKKGEALLIGPHNHYSVIRVSLPQEFPATAKPDTSGGAFGRPPKPPSP